MGNDFPHLFSPFDLGGVTLKNRLVALPAGTSMAEHGVPTHGDTEHFERLAAGGVGLIIGGATVVHPTTTLRSRKLIEGYRDEFVPAAAAKADVIHRHGARFIGQLCHLGREFIGGESDSPPSAPSAIKTARDAYPPHELTVAEIEDIVEGWRISTENLVKAGADGVEVHAAHGYLPAQFMSPLTNRRTDSFGGSFENRMRFTRLVIEAMRSVIPAGFVLGVRLSGEEEIPGGMDIEDCVRSAENLSDLGIDYFSITHGTRGKYVKDSTNEDGVAIPSASRVRAATGVPTLVGQRIRDAATADHAIKNGHVDMVGMARALIADPDLPIKSADRPPRRDPRLSRDQSGLPGIRPTSALCGERRNRSWQASGRGSPGAEVQGGLRDRRWPGRTGSCSCRSRSGASRHLVRTAHSSRWCRQGCRCCTPPRDPGGRHRLSSARTPTPEGRCEPFCRYRSR